jgi:hypothetical protein
LQDQLKVIPLSAWGKPYTPPDNVAVDPNVDTTSTPFDQVRLMFAGTFFSRLAHAMKDNPPYPADSPMVEKLKKIGVEAGKDFDINKVDPNVAKGLNRAPAEIWSLLTARPYTMKGPNGWILAFNLGRYGTDYQTRALIAFTGLGALTPEDHLVGWKAAGQWYFDAYSPLKNFIRGQQRLSGPPHTATVVRDPVG